MWTGETASELVLNIRQNEMEAWLVDAWTEFKRPFLLLDNRALDPTGFVATLHVSVDEYN